ncbi:hypothetical protein Ancab_004166, partial [Ancistrocladus abbreviatus]
MSVSLENLEHYLMKEMKNAVNRLTKSEKGQTQGVQEKLMAQVGFRQRPIVQGSPRETQQRQRKLQIK